MTDRDHPADRPEADRSTGDPVSDSSPEGTTAGAETLPADVVDDIERLTRLARATRDEHEAAQYAQRRDELLSAHEFTARIREEADGDVLVCHPERWLADGVIRTDRIEDVSRAVEVPLEGAEDPEDWAAVDEHNRAIARTVRDTHGEVHGANATALADFVSNHYAKSIESLTAAELEEFREEYFVRNAWPTDRQRAVIDESIRLVFETADVSVPEYGR